MTSRVVEDPAYCVNPMITLLNNDDNINENSHLQYKHRHRIIHKGYFQLVNHG